MYTFDGRVRYSEVGEDGCMSLESLLNYFQDCSTFHSEDIGLGMDYLKGLGQVWLLSAWQICIERYPRLSERIVIGTAPYEFRGFMGCRNFLMKTEAGEVLAYANSIWTLLDASSMRPAKPNEKMLEGYVIEEKYPMNYAPRKIAVPANGKAVEPFTVKLHHLDTNHHVNNGQYVQLAERYLPEGFVIRQMRAEYKKQAVLNDRIYPKAGRCGDGYTILMEDGSGKTYAVVEFI